MLFKLKLLDLKPQKGQYVNQVQSKEAFDYRIHGADAANFDIETITDGSCGNGGKSCAKIWLQDGVTLDREEKAQYSIMCKSLYISGRSIFGTRGLRDGLSRFNFFCLALKTPILIHMSAFLKSDPDGRI